MSQTATGSHPAASWSAVELVVTSDSPAGRHGTPSSRLLARVIYQALFDHDRRSVTLLALSGHQRERYLLRSRAATDAETDTELLAKLAYDTLPLEVGIAIVDVDPAPLGKTPVPVHRLLTTRDTPVEGKPTPTPTPFEQLLTTVAAMRPHAVQLIASRFDDEWLEVSIRIADFSPGVTIQTATGDARYHETAPDVAAPFDAYNLTTNRALIFDHGWEHHTESRLPGPAVPMITHAHGAAPTVETIESARTLSRSPTEYEALFHDRQPDAPLTSTYANHKVLPWVRLDAELLPAFCGLRAQTYHTSPWARLPGRALPTITPRHTIREPAPPPASSPRPPTPTPVEFALETPLGHTALDWVREHGAVVTDEPNCPFEAFTAEYPARTHRCLILTDPTFTRGDFITVAAGVHHAPETDTLTVFADSPAIAARARACLQQPFVITSAGKTRLYRQSMRLPTTLETAVQRRASDSEWILTPTGAVEYHYNGTVVTRDARDATFTSRTSGFPQVSHQDGEFTVTNPVDGARRSYPTREACFEEFEFVHPPAVPTWLASGLAFGTVLTTAGDDFHEYQTQARWDRPNLPGRNSAAAAEFFATYTVGESAESLALPTVESEFVEWLRHQTAEPIRGSFTSSLKTAFPGTLSDFHSDDLQARTWRYPFEHSR